MALTFNKAQPFVEALFHGKHDFSSDQLTIALTNTAHNNAWTKLADLTQVAYTNLSSRDLTTSSSSQTGGTYKLVLADLVLTSTGGTTGAFQYIYIYNDTATDKDLVGYFDYGSALTLADGQSITLDFSAVNGVLTNA